MGVTFEVLIQNITHWISFSGPSPQHCPLLNSAGIRIVCTHRSFIRDEYHASTFIGSIKHQPFIEISLCRSHVSSFFLPRQNGWTFEAKARSMNILQIDEVGRSSGRWRRSRIMLKVTVSSGFELRYLTALNARATSELPIQKIYWWTRFSYHFP